MNSLLPFVAVLFIDRCSIAKGRQANSYLEGINFFHKLL